MHLHIAAVSPLWFCDVTLNKPSLLLVWEVWISLPLPSMQYYLVTFLCTCPSLNSVSLNLVARIIYVIPGEIQAVSCCNIALPLLETYHTIILRLAFPFLQLQSTISSVIKVS